MRAYPIALMCTLAGVACTRAGNTDDTVDTDCDRSLDAYCDETCAVLADRVPSACADGDAFLVERCGDDGTMWEISTCHIGYLFVVTHEYFDATGALVAYVHSEDAPLSCGDYSVVYGTIPGCETSTCTYMDCGGGDFGPPPACSGGADPPPR